MVVATPSTLRRVEFDLQSFASVYGIEFPKMWGSVSLGEIDEDEAEIARKFLNLLANGTEVSEDKLLLVKSEDGTPVNLYGASLFRESLDNENLVIKFGNNIFPCEFDGTTVTVGQLSGEFVFTDKEASDGTRYQLVTIELNPNDDPYTTYPVNVAVQKGINLVKPMFKAALRDGGIAQFFNVPSTGGEGTPTYNLQDLEVGEYAIAALHQYEKKDTTYGLYCYVIELEGGFKVWAKGGSQNQLLQADEEKGTKSNKRFAGLSAKVKNAPYKLKISKIESYQKGTETKWSINNQIMPGVPKQIGAYPTKVIQQAPLQLEAASNAEIVFNNKTQAIAWAIEQGLTDSEAEQCFVQINPKLAKQDRQIQFMTLVGDALKATIQPTIEVMSSEISEDDIPY